MADGARALGPTCCKGDLSIKAEHKALEEMTSSISLSSKTKTTRLRDEGRPLEQFRMTSCVSFESGRR